MTTDLTRRVGRPASAPTNRRARGAAGGRHADSQRADIIDLILAQHRRIRRLADVLETAGRRDDADASHHVAGLVWRRLAELLDVYTEVEREICFLPLFGASRDSDGQWLEAIADQEDIRAAIQEAALQPADSPAWWRAVSAAARFTRSHLDTVEKRVLAGFARDASPELRRTLGEQWVRFTAALRQDRSDDSMAAPAADARPSAGALR